MHRWAIGGLLRGRVGSRQSFGRLERPEREYLGYQVPRGMQLPILRAAVDAQIRCWSALSAVVAEITESKKTLARERAATNLRVACRVASDSGRD